MFNASKEDMSQALNDFLVNIGASTEEKITQPNKHFPFYLNNPNESTIFLYLALVLNYCQSLRIYVLPKQVDLMVYPLIY